MSIQVLARHDKIILQQVETKEEFVGRIVLSDIAKEKANTFKVVSIGPGVTNPFTGQFTPTQYQVGDEVFVYKVNTNMIEVDGEEYFITRDSDILCYNLSDESINISSESTN